MINWSVWQVTKMVVVNKYPQNWLEMKTFLVLFLLFFYCILSWDNYQFELLFVLLLLLGLHRFKAACNNKFFLLWSQLKTTQILSQWKFWRRSKLDGSRRSICNMVCEHSEDWSSHWPSVHPAIHPSTHWLLGGAENMSVCVYLQSIHHTHRPPMCINLSNWTRIDIFIRPFLSSCPRQAFNNITVLYILRIATLRVQISCPVVTCHSSFSVISYKSCHCEARKQHSVFSFPSHNNQSHRPAVPFHPVSFPHSISEPVYCGGKVLLNRVGCDN